MDKNERNNQNFTERSRSENKEVKNSLMKTNHDLEQISVMQFSTNEVLTQIKKIQELMQQAMKDGEHFGKIPGCGDKPTLLKPGAEKLSFMFRLAPRYEITIRDLGKGHREYDIITSLYHISTGNFFGQGVGSCSTMESKFKYRWIDSPYKPKKEEADRLKHEGKGRWRKNGNDWIWQDRIEYDNPADHYNTIEKMAKKRSLVDSILTATAASDIFTQDLEELEDEELSKSLIDDDKKLAGSIDAKKENNVFDRNYSEELQSIESLDDLKNYYQNLSEKEKKNLSKLIKNRKEEILKTV